MLQIWSTSILRELSLEIARTALRGLGIKYSIVGDDLQYVMSPAIQEEFDRCLNVAIGAFLKSTSKTIVSENNEFDKPRQKIISDYLKSPEVVDEIWHLLDPGSEFFDKGYLAKLAHEEMSSIFGESTQKNFFNAWEEFLKAFSFASRSTPGLREFLRASYEAGSFKALSNIEDVLERMDRVISDFENEEITISQSIKQYTDELKTYKNWAISFQVNQ